jgi:serine/threonine-protein kinase RsbW
MEFHLSARGDHEGLQDLSCALAAVLRRNRVDPQRIDDIMLIVEEIIANAIDHGFAEGICGEVSARISADAERLQLELSDTGRPFNPLEHPDPNLDLDILDRPVGGLGIHLVKELSESVYYRRDGQRNVVGCLLHRHPAAPGDHDEP